jgi:plasmid stabilization system protein ParE
MKGAYFHPEAETDLNDIWDFIAQDNPAAADRVTEEIVAAIETLANSPRIGHRRPDLTSRPLRFWLVRNYLVAYAPEEKPLWVIAVIHGSRNPRVMAAILRTREA